FCIRDGLLPPSEAPKRLRIAQHQRAAARRIGVVGCRKQIGGSTAPFRSRLCTAFLIISNDDADQPKSTGPRPEGSGASYQIYLICKFKAAHYPRVLTASFSLGPPRPIPGRTNQLLSSLHQSVTNKPAMHKSGGAFV